MTNDERFELAGDLYAAASADACELRESLERERARSAKLLGALKRIGIFGTLDSNVIWAICDQAIAEYEAGK